MAEAMVIDVWEETKGKPKLRPVSPTLGLKDFDYTKTSENFKTINSLKNREMKEQNKNLIRKEKIDNSTFYVPGKMFPKIIISLVKFKDQKVLENPKLFEIISK